MVKFKERHGESVVVDAEDVDEPFIYQGKELTDERAEQIAAQTLAELAELRRRNLIPGGKSLSGGRQHSPTVQFRVPAELRARLEERARAEHRSPSKIAREALERYLAE